MKNRDDVFAAIVAHPFATLVTTSGGRIDVSQLPMWLERESGTLHGHFARANPHWRMLEGADDVALIFTGPHGYISPGWYTDPTLVPTWNYVSITVHGRATLLDTVQDARLIVSRLSAQHEARFPKPWTLDKVPESKIASLLRAIVACRIDPTRIDAKAKLGQNRDAADIAGAITGLRATPAPSVTAALADEMARALNLR
jgi:transcriptional regulator